jgi:hypothetical protein
MNELSTIALQDGQIIRPFYNYLQETFEQIKGKEFTFDEVKFENEREFYTHLKGVINLMLSTELNESPKLNLN